MSYVNPRGCSQIYLDLQQPGHQIANNSTKKDRYLSHSELNKRYPEPRPQHAEQGAQSYSAVQAFWKIQTQTGKPLVLGAPPKTDDNRTIIQKLTHRTAPNPNHTPNYIKYEYRDNAVAKIDNAHDKKSHELSLERHGLTSLPPTIEVLDCVENFLLQFNCLQSLPPQISGMHELKFLDLRCNDLLSLPSEIGTLQNLVKLDLRENDKLTKLPENIGNLGRLTFLHVDHCNIKNVPVSIGDCASLKHLSLSENSIDMLPSSIGNLSQLQTLNLANTMVSVFPETFNSVIENSLKEINLARTPFGGFSMKLENPRRLRSVNLIGTQVKMLPHKFGSFVFCGNRMDKNIRQPKHGLLVYKDLLINAAQTYLTENLMHLGRLPNSHLNTELYLENKYLQGPPERPTDHDAGSDADDDNVAFQRYSGYINPPDDEVMQHRTYKENNVDSNSRADAWIKGQAFFEQMNDPELGDVPPIKHSDMQMGPAAPGPVLMQLAPPINPNPINMISIGGGLLWPDLSAKSNTAPPSMLEIPTQPQPHPQGYLIQGQYMTPNPALYPPPNLTYIPVEQNFGTNPMWQNNQNQYAQQAQPPAFAAQNTPAPINVENAIHAATQIKESTLLMKFF